MLLRPQTFAILLSILAGTSTGIGGLLVILFKKTNTRLLSVILGFSAGIMLYISFIEIYPEAQNTLLGIHDERKAKILTAMSFFLGMTLMAFINKLIPEPSYPRFYSKGSKKFHVNSKLLRTGFMTALAVSIHNFPEGVATFISGVKDTNLGLSMALAIAIHNIPEGVAIAAPVYHSTQSKAKALLFSFFSGLSEPLGAIVALLILGPLMTVSLSGIIFGAVAGVMVYISLDELLPTAREYGEQHLSFLGLMLGMATMALNIIFFF